MPKTHVLPLDECRIYPQTGEFRAAPHTFFASVASVVEWTTVATGQGFEPRFPDSESDFLPLEDSVLLYLPYVCLSKLPQPTLACQVPNSLSYCPPYTRTYLENDTF